MKRLITFTAILLIVISGQGVDAQYNFLPQTTLSQTTADAWFTLSNVVRSQFSPDGRYLAVRTATQFRVYDISPERTTPSLIIEEATRTCVGHAKKVPCRPPAFERPL